jgi:hypothetical protein
MELMWCYPHVLIGKQHLQTQRSAAANDGAERFGNSATPEDFGLKETWLR